MAKTKQPATEAEAFEGATLVERPDLNFNQPILEADTGPRGSDMAAQMDAIRSQREAQRKAKGPAMKRRKVTNYHDAERLKNLYAAGHTHLATADELVDWEEDGLLPNPEHYATGTTAETKTLAVQGQIMPPAKGEAA